MEGLLFSTVNVGTGEKFVCYREYNGVIVVRKSSSRWDGKSNSQIGFQSLLRTEKIEHKYFLFPNTKILKIKEEEITWLKPVEKFEDKIRNKAKITSMVNICSNISWA